MRIEKIDKITITGAVLGTASLLFPLVTLKPNRIDDGSPLGWLAVGGAVSLFAALILLTGLFFLGRGGPPPRRAYSKGLLGTALFGLAFGLAGPGGLKFLGEDLPYGRITLSSGFWMLMAAVWMIQNGVFRHLSRGWRQRGLLILPLLVFTGLLLSGGFSGLSLTQEFLLKRSRLLREMGNHLRLAGSAVFLSLCLGIPLGILGWKRRGSEKPIFFFLNSVQTIPSLALFGLLIAPLSYLSFRYPLLRRMGIQGVGSAPALIALTLYALLPVARNTFVGLSVVDPDILQAGRGMGMGPGQLFRQVEVPMALPIILTGIRIAAIQAVGNTAVAALIGAGGFGVFIFQGLGQGAPDLILLGVLPVIALAVILDRLLSLIIRLTASPGLVPDEERVTPGGGTND